METKKESFNKLRTTLVSKINACGSIKIRFKEYGNEYHYWYDVDSGNLGFVLKNIWIFSHKDCFYYIKDTGCSSFPELSVYELY